MKRIITLKSVCEFEKHLLCEEKSSKTVDKYVRDVNALALFLGDREVSRQSVLDYKQALSKGYAATSANSMLAAINKYFDFRGWSDLRVRQLRIQKNAFRSDERELKREEYARLVGAARGMKNQRLALILQTICATGIRVSELAHITVEAAISGRAVVSSKGKTRTIIIVDALKNRLLRYAGRNGIESGVIFLTRGGKPVNRCSVWREMKGLCSQAGVEESKVYPHNLRHLFATTFYSMEKDIVKLADVLGHSSINTTRIYVETTGAEHRRKMEKMRLII